MPATDEQIDEAMRRRGVASAWPQGSPAVQPAEAQSMTAPDASRPVIPADATISLTLWGPDSPDQKTKMSLGIKQGVVTGSLDFPNMKEHAYRTFNRKDTFEGKLVENRIVGTHHSDWVWEYDLINMPGWLRHQVLGTHDMQLELKLDGTVLGSAKGNWTYKSTYHGVDPASAQIFKNTEGSHGPEHYQIMGVWKFDRRREADPAEK
jgi:hypothetical protein